MACCAWPSSAQALTGGAAVAALNAQRAANGIPADLTERREWSAACRAHNRYMQVNNVFGGVEDPHVRGLTPEVTAMIDAELAAAQAGASREGQRTRSRQPVTEQGGAAA